MTIPLFAVLALAAPPTEVSGVVISQPQVIEEADLTAKPSGRDVTNAFPLGRQYRGIIGVVKMRCTVDIAGKVRDCESLTERPYGLGFGDAATGLMERSGRFKPRRVNGKAVDGGQVEFTLELWSGISGERVLTNPVWAAAPNADEVAAAWPAGVPGDEAVVVMHCRVGKTGEMEDCATVRPVEAPLADAGRALIGKFRVKLTEAEARQLARAEVVISFRLLNPASEAGKARVVRQPEWTTVLDAAQVQAIFPDTAADAGVQSGRGVADCLVAADGSLTECRIVSERPAALGFGEAAVQVAQTMRMNLWSEDGRPTVGARIRLPVEFSLVEGAAK